MAEGFRIASAYVEIHADDKPLYAEVAAAVKAVASGDIKLPVKADVDPASVAAAAGKVRAGMDAAGAGKVKIDPVVDPAAAMKGVAKLRAALAGLRQIDKLTIEAGVDIDRASLLKAVAEARAALYGALGEKHGVDVSPIFDESAFKAVMAETAAMTRNASRSLADYELTTKRAGAAAAVAGLQIDKLQADFFKARDGADQASQATRRLYGWWGLFGGQVSLFAGAAKVSAFHVALDAAVETLAVLVPALTTAAAGLAAFGAAGYDAGRQVYHQLLNIHTVSDALNATIPPMTGNLEKLHDTVRPMVWQLYGDAISIATHNTGLFNKLALETGGAIDRMAARITVAMTRGGGGLERFFASGRQDLIVIGQILSNLGHVALQLIKVTQDTHIAEFLLQGVNAASKLLSVIASLPVPLLAVVAGLHGLYLWGGIAVTQVSKLVGVFTGMGSKAVDAGLATGVFLEKAGAIGKAAEGASIGTRAWAAANAVLTKVPVWGWAAAGVVAIGALGYALSRTKDSTDHFVDSLDAAVSKATIFTSLNVLTTSIAKSTAQLAVANQALASSGREVVKQSGEILGRFGPLNTSITLQAADVGKLQAEHDKLVGTMQLETSRLARLAGTYGTDLAGAMALATTAGVRLSDLQSKDARVWAQAQAQIDGLVLGYKNMGIQGDALHSALNVLTVSQSDQLRTVTQLNSAYDQWIKNLAAPRDTFISFARSITTWGQDAQQAGASMSGLAGQVVKMSKTVSTTSLNLQADFQSAFSNANQLFDALRTSAAPAGTFDQVVKEMVATLLPLTQGNKAAVAEVSALAQEAGGPATTSIQALQGWVGKSINPLKGMQDATNKVVIATSNLSLDAQKLSSTLQDDLNVMMAAAILKTSGAASAMERYSRDLQANQEDTARGRSDRAALISDLEKAGLNAKQAASEADALSAALGKIKSPPPVNIKVTADGTLYSSIPSVQKVLHDPRLGGAAGGGIIPGYAPGRDVVHLLASPGEGILVPEAVAAIGPANILAINRIFGRGRRSTGAMMAGGGIAGMPGFVTRGTSLEENATENVMGHALATAFQDVISASGLGAGGIPGPVPNGPVQQMARALLAAMGWANQWGAFNSLVMAESGWNVHATNPTSGAYGIPQALPPSKMASAGADWATNPATQLRWMMGYISGRYGDPDGAWAHEQAFHWYGRGTGGAAPGWAVVGERGPELVRMHGGEMVLDAGTSALLSGMAGHAYAGGTSPPRPGEFCSLAEHGRTRDGLVCRKASDGSWRWENPSGHRAGHGHGGGHGGGGGSRGLTGEQRAGLTIMKDFAGANSAAQVLTDMRNFIKDIALYFKGPHARWREAMVRRQATAMERTATKITALNDKIKTAQQYQKDTMSGLQSFADLSALSSGGPIFGPHLTGGQAIEMQLQGKLAALKKFGSALAQLQKARVPSSLIRQIVALGPDAGLQFAQQILAGGSGLIEQLSATENQITAQETLLSQQATNAVFGYTGTGKQFLHGLLAEKAQLEKVFKSLGRTLGLEAARWFGVPRNRIPRFDEGGWLMPGQAGVNTGSSPELMVPEKNFAKLAEAIAAAISPLLRTPVEQHFHGQLPNAEQRTHLMRELAFASSNIR